MTASGLECIIHCGVDARPRQLLQQAHSPAAQRAAVQGRRRQQLLGKVLGCRTGTGSIGRVDTCSTGKRHVERNRERDQRGNDSSVPEAL